MKHDTKMFAVIQKSPFVDIDKCLILNLTGLMF